mgnify:CR=1 FL=1
MQSSEPSRRDATAVTLEIRNSNPRDNARSKRAITASYVYLTTRFHSSCHGPLARTTVCEPFVGGEFILLEKYPLGLGRELLSSSCSPAVEKFGKNRSTNGRKMYYRYVRTYVSMYVNFSLKMLITTFDAIA